MKAGPLAAVGAILVLVSPALGGCGDGGVTQSTSTASAPAPPLTKDERDLLARSQRAAELYCSDLALSVTHPRKTPSARERDLAFAAVDRIIELTREKPAAQAESGVDMQLFLSDLAEDLEGANCEQALLDRIEEGLATIPPQ